MSNASQSPGSPEFSVKLIPILKDNYVFVICYRHYAVVVDPGDAKPVIEALSRWQLECTHILVTHHHWDHTDGLPELCKQFPGAVVVGPTRRGIKAITHPTDGLAETTLTFPDQNTLPFTLLDVSGHTLDQTAYYAPDHGWLFSGDALFIGGCGRLIEGNVAMGYAALQRINALPSSTVIYCAHEYTEQNLRFLATHFPEITAVQTALAQNSAIRATGSPTVPTTLGSEQSHNLFLRTHEPAIQALILQKAHHWGPQYQPLIEATFDSAVKCYGLLRLAKDLA